MVSEKIKTVLKGLKKPKILIVLGFVGIALIFLSSVTQTGTGKSEIKSESTIDTDEYCKLLKEGVKSIVYGITGDNDATVVITLESSERYSYADRKESDLSSSSGSNTEQSSESISQSYITVKSSDGGEEPLIITRLMPDIRGVAVICNGGDNDDIREKIEGAITAALNITAKRVYITGGNSYEKR